MWGRYVNDVPAFFCQHYSLKAVPGWVAKQFILLYFAD